MDPFWGLGVALGVNFGRVSRDFGGVSRNFGEVSRNFGGLGVALGAFGAQSSPKAASPFRGPPFLSDFGAQMVPKRLPKWS